MKLLYIFFLCLLDSVGRTHLRSRDLLLLRALVDERLVDVRDHAAASNGGLDERVELLVTADGELQVAGGDALHLKVLARVTGELEDLGGEVLEDGRGVHGGGGADALADGDLVLQETVDAAHRELLRGERRRRREHAAARPSAGREERGGRE